jgi:beta-barrel assembly-enhancing protease
MNRKQYFAVLAVAMAASWAWLAGCKTSDLVSTSDEVSIGRQAAAQVESQNKISHDPALNRLVTNTGNTILRTVPVRTGITYTFKVIDTADINAFSLPGGWVYVENGLIEATKGDVNQLAGVMAHEIGHVQARHAAQMIGRQEIYGVAIGTLTKGDTAKIAGIFANLNLLQYSRDEEYQADQLAVDYLLPSQYDPQGLINFFKVLMQKEGSGGGPEFLRTHPLTQDRINRLQAYLDSKRGK